MDVQVCLICIIKGIFVMAALSHLVSSRNYIYVDPSATNSTDTNECWTGTVPCKYLELGLRGLQQSSGHTTLRISAGNYSVNSNETIFKFENISDIAIVGDFVDKSIQSDTPPVSVICDKKDGQFYLGLTFIHSRNISISGVGMIGCGTLQNSTSKNFTQANKDKSPFRFAEFNVTLYFLYCTDVTLQFVHINESFGVGAVFYSTIGKNVIEKSIFYCNSAQNNTQGGGGLFIEFSYCVPNTDGTYNNCTSDSNVPLSYAQNAQYFVTHSIFDNNVASLVDANKNTFILPQKSEHLAFGRGGGISVFFKGNATNNEITISYCTLSNNQALWGAGIFVEYQDMSYGNTFVIQDSSIKNNNVLDYSTASGTGGGGSRVGFIYFGDTHAKENNITFRNVTFTQNRAYFGGGLSFYTAREPSIIATNVLLLYNCTWVENVARVGSGVDLSVWHPVAQGAVVKPLFSNCTFRHNNADYTKVTSSGTLVGLGTFYSESIPTEFDFVHFTGNFQTALAAVGTGIYFSSNSVALFESNTGRNGGAIALMGYAFIEVAKNTVLNFINNSADLKGGAIYGQSTGEHDLISSRNCFIRYSDINSMPQDWNLRFNFVNNSVKNKPNSIFVTSLLTCLWGGAFGSVQCNNTSEVFCWNKNGIKWHYGGNCSEHIETSPAYFNPKLDISSNHSQYSMLVIPGRRKILPFSTFNDKDVNITPFTVFVAQIDESENYRLSLDNSSVYISDNRLEVHGNPGASGIVKIETVDPRVVSTNVNVTIEKCPPGMILSSNKNGSKATCTCGTGDLYNNALSCNQDSYTTSLLRGSWIGEVDVNGSPELLVGLCPFCASIEPGTRYISLSNVKIANLNAHLCEKIHRTGTLCGNCIQNYGPAVNSPDIKCLKCTDEDRISNWFFYLLTEFLPVTIFFFVVVLFNISVTSGPANAFVFFAQMVTTALKLDGDGLIQPHLIVNNSNISYDDLVRVVPYGYWNLNFFRPFFPSFCLSSQITTLQLLSTGYITAFYPFLLVAVFFVVSWLYSRGFRPVVFLCRPLHTCFARVTRIWDIKKSIVHALATFLVLSYTKFTQVSFTLLTADWLAFPNGSTASLRLYYAGNIVFGSSEHVPYMIPAIVVLATFVAIPPIILIVPSIIHVLQKCCHRHRMPDLCGGAWFSQFLNAFHGCYKDGTGGENNKYDFRWFAGMYFLLRIALLAILAFTEDWFLQSTLQLAVCIAVNFVFVVFRPYKNDLYNKVDAGFFSLITLLCCLSLKNYYDSQSVYNTLPLWPSVFQYLLFLCPLVYISVVIVYYLWNRNKAFFERMYRKCSRSKLSKTEEHVQDDYDFFQDAEEAGRFRDPEKSPNDETQPLFSPPISTNSSGTKNPNRSSNSGSHTSAGTQKPNTFEDNTFESSGVGRLEGPFRSEEDSDQKRKRLFLTR